MMTEVHIATITCVRWFIDSGASVHICKDKAQFKSYEEVIDKKVFMGNHSVANVLRLGVMELQFISGKKLTKECILCS